MRPDPPPHDAPDDRPHATELPSELDRGLSHAYGAHAPSEVAPSVLARIGDLAGSIPRVSLRDDSAGDTPMLKPLDSRDRVSAGKYVVHGELGRGGVGAVHRGHDQDLGRDVALKFLHERYKDEPAILHRFVEEAQIGGQLQHPGIVPVYDLGLVDGRPFFAMKLVKGQTLAKKLADRASPADDRRGFLSIFEDVCQTLAYAHARGVVHRDLKPGNIMIGSFGEVQVVDWGMGKVLRQGGIDDEQLSAARRSQLSVIATVRSGGHGTQSLVGSVMGTPAYMPPEQARGDVEAMDERSDVFALGAILCEILTGKPPYVGDSDELLGLAAMAKLDDANARLAACEAEPELVELATRCLMPAPAARPRSAEVVAKAVRDHLAAAEARVHEARVEAAEAKVRAASLKRLQTMGISLTVVIAAGLAASLWFWREASAAAESEKIAALAAVASAQSARDNEQRALEQTEIAERELARAVEIKTLITDMLKGITPEQAMGADTTLLKGVLDTASGRLASGAIEDELVAAELHAVTGWVYSSIGLYPEAEQHIPVALEIRERLVGADDERTLGSVENLGTLRLYQGRYPEAEALYRRTLEGRERELGKEHEETIRARVNMSALLWKMGRFSEAEALSHEVLEVARRVLGEEHGLTLSALQGRADHLENQGRHEEAEAVYLELLEILERARGEMDRHTLSCMSSLANLYMKKGRYANAEPLQRRALEGCRRVYGAQHPTTLSAILDLANILGSMGRDAEAGPMLTEALAVQERLLGEDHPDTLRSAGLLGTCLTRQGRLDEAEVLQLRCWTGRVRVLGEAHMNTLGSLGNLAILYKLQERYAEAEELFEKLLELQTRSIGADHPSTMGTHVNLALLYNELGRLEEAEELLLPVLESQRRMLGEEHRDTLGTLTNLGNLYNSMGRFEDAAGMFEVSLPAKRRVLGDAHPWTGYALEGLVQAYLNLGRTEDALPLQRQVLERTFAERAGDDPSAEALDEYARTLLTTDVEGLRDPVRALDLASRACERAETEQEAQLWQYLDTLALAQHTIGDDAAAVATQRRALALMPEGANPEVSERLAEYEAALEDDSEE